MLSSNLNGSQVLPHAPVIIIHFWNERLPPIPPEGPDLGWAKRSQRLFLSSLHCLSDYLDSSSTLDEVQAIGGVTIALYGEHGASGERFMRRLGFTVLPSTHKLGKFGLFIDNLYSWVMIWIYSPAGLSYRHLTSLKRSEVWISRKDLQKRFGKQLRGISKSDE